MRKRTFLSVVIAVAFTIGASTMISCGDNSKDNPEHQKSEEVHEHAKTYQCPMKCEGDKTYEESGECPVCHMDLKETEHNH